MIPPGRATGETFGVLPHPVPGEVTDGQLGHDHDAYRCAGLGLNEPQLAANAMKRPANVKLPRVQIDIRPSQAKAAPLRGTAAHPPPGSALGRPPGTGAPT